MMMFCLHATCIASGSWARHGLHAEQVGDWGRDGHDNQTLVAAAMGSAARDLDFIISTGDNFYGTLPSIALAPEVSVSDALLPCRRT